MSKKLQLVDGNSEIRIEVEVTEEFVRKLELEARHRQCSVEELVELALTSEVE